MRDTVFNLLSVLSLGLFLGMRHATDADHVVAIATIVSRERTLASSALIGAAWGIGHTVTVVTFGVAIISFGVVIPPSLGLSMELAVGIMLVILGVLTLTGVGRTASVVAGSGAPGGHTPLAHDHVHSHGDYIHWHAHGHGAEPHGHAELDRSWQGRLGLYRWMRPFVVGAVHGLGGSAAIALMVLSIIHDARAAIGYLLLFGLGTVGGMMLITFALSAPFTLTARNLPKFNWQLRVATSLTSFVFGVVLIYGTGFAQGGFSRIRRGGSRIERAIA